jgi:hypothetical protein
MIFDLGICCFLWAFLLYFFLGVALNVGGFLCLFLAVGLSVLLKEKRKQFLPLIVIPMLGGLLLRLPWIELMVYVPVWGYLVFLLKADRFVISRGEFLDRVTKLLSMCLILPIFMLTEFHTFQEAIGAAIPYIITTIVSIVFMLRHLRNEHRTEGHKGYYLQQVWELMMFLVVSVLLAIARAPQNLWKGIQLLYDYIIQPIISALFGLISMIFGGIIYLLLSLLSLAVGSRELAQRRDEMGDVLNEIPDVTVTKVSNQEWILPLLYSLGLILGLVLLFFFFRWLLGTRSRQKLPTGVSELREELTDPYDTKKKFRWKYSKEPAERIRYYYYKYLLYLRSKKVKIMLGDTTGEVNRKYSEMISEPSEEQKEAAMKLMKLYREARYQEQKEMSLEEAEKANQLYHRIKNQK